MYSGTVFEGLATRSSSQVSSCPGPVLPVDIYSMGSQIYLVDVVVFVLRVSNALRGGSCAMSCLVLSAREC